MNKIVKNTLILTAITVVAGLLLGVVYGVTKDPIAKSTGEGKTGSISFCSFRCRDI